MLTRPQPQLEHSADLLEAAGYRVLRLPIMQIAAPSQPPRQRDLRWAENANWLIFTSRHSVAAALKLWPQAPQKPRIAAVGQGTGSALQAHGWPLHWQAPGGNSESLLDAPEAPKWQGDIAILAGRGGRRRIKQGLLEHGCQVRKILLYQRRPRDWAADDLIQCLQQRPIAVFSSGYGLRRWHALVQQHKLAHGLALDMLVASPRLCKLANQLGFSGQVQALPIFSDEAIRIALNEWNHD